MELHEVIMKACAGHGEMLVGVALAFGTSYLK